VAGASREQTQGITQINSAVGLMDKVTQGNAANAEESAAAAEELNAQAGVMKQSVAELLQLVGGRENSRTIGAGTPAAPARAKEARVAAPVAKRPAPIHGNGHARTAPASASVAKGRSEIPLEGDFKDF
jgi:methyl-accepting chemotaxis protein